MISRHLKNMAVRMFRANGPVHIEWYQKTASTAFAFDEPVYLGTAGRLLAYTPGVAAPFLGLCKQTIASSSATTARIPVEVGNYDTEYLIDATTTAAALTDVGEWVDYVTSTRSVDVGVSTADDFFVTMFLSTTLVVGKFARRIASNNLNTAFS
jgi:hypothetical protein